MPAAQPLQAVLAPSTAAAADDEETEVWTTETEEETSSLAVVNAPTHINGQVRVKLHVR